MFMTFSKTTKLINVERFVYVTLTLRTTAVVTDHKSTAIES